MDHHVFLSDVDDSSTPSLQTAHNTLNPIRNEDMRDPNSPPASQPWGKAHFLSLLAG